jgi:Na+/proline symporter
MKVKAASAYELLEARLGVSGRLLGASMFVGLRLIWMAAILYATSDKVLIPLLKLPASAMPWLCAVLGLITVAYTTDGGLRAVVVTDALQALIMFAGAIACVVVVSVRLGDWNAWWPQAWHPHWDEPVWFDATAAHVPIFCAFVNMLVYMTCTAGSDQMAVQRYLATEDIKAARRSFNISLVADVVVHATLALAGLAILAYVIAYPSLFPGGAETFQSADRLFPTFIVVGLPPGLTGLLIAAILSAAMSSLASGINSSCAVVVTDFIDRFRSGQESKSDTVSVARWVSIAIGAMIVLLSMLIGQISGNLLELCSKVVNLLTAPLFVLFFLAIFVPWSTPLSAYAATIASVTVGAGVAFGSWFGLGFLWMGLCSLLSGIAMGLAVSLWTRAYRRLQGASIRED